ncbi:unnamed protein product [Medioppia subpectinata]|uniref:Glycine-rich protein n=1 Tax=Medioppia subpectinata TaxID=1979941 RepID=A0A7R9L6T5_9ACAR|nr:unnamed protein product [Medioppia subpectinata]CAG2116210.1 unnamed protein product [Medioppia subpectinata]
MVYINSRGEVMDNQSLSWSTPWRLVLSVLNFFYFFFQTLFPFGSRFGEPTNSRNNGRRGGGGGGGGGGGWGGGGGRPNSNIRTLGPSRCGPNAPPAGGG